MASNDNDTVPVNKKALIKFIESFVEYGYGQSSDTSVPDEWEELLDRAFAVRNDEFRKGKPND